MVIVSRAVGLALGEAPPFKINRSSQKRHGALELGYFGDGLRYRLHQICRTLAEMMSGKGDAGIQVRMARAAHLRHICPVREDFRERRYGFTFGPRF